MDGITVALLLSAAVCHTVWNLRLKCCDEKNLVIWWSLIVIVPLALPMVWRWGVPLSTWPLMAASVLCQVGYYYALTRAYTHGDFSVVYPVARGSAPALVLLWATLFLHERLRPLGICGVFIIIIGVTVAGNLWQLLRRGPNRPEIKTAGLIAAFQVAICISGYTTLDGAAVKQAQPLAYTSCLFALVALAVTPLLARRPWPELRAVLVKQRADIVIIAVLSLLAYMLVLFAYSRGTVAYAAAGREMSIVFGAIAGWRFLGEGLGAMRVLGAVLIFSGILTIAIWG